jgi:hypothetical protein
MKIAHHLILSTTTLFVCLGLSPVVLAQSMQSYNTVSQQGYNNNYNSNQTRGYGNSSYNNSYNNKSSYGNYSSNHSSYNSSSYNNSSYQNNRQSGHGNNYGQSNFSNYAMTGYNGQRYRPGATYGNTGSGNMRFSGNMGYNSGMRTALSASRGNITGGMNTPRHR